MNSLIEVLPLMVYTNQNPNKMIITNAMIEAQERKNENRARVMAFLFLLIMIAIFILPFISSKLETAQQYEKVIMIQFDDEFFEAQASADKSSAEAAAQGGDSAEEEPEVVEESAEAVEEPVEEPVEEVVEEFSEEPDPIVEETEPVAEKAIATNDDSKVKMSVDEMMKEMAKKKKKNKSKPANGNSEGDSDELSDYFKKNKGKSSGSGKATGSGKSNANGNGKSKTAGEGTSGKSTTGKSKLNGQGNGSGGDDFAGDGLLTRKVIRRANVESLIKEPGRMVINLCVNRDGAVVFSEVNKRMTTLTDRSLLKDAEYTATKYRYEKDYTAAERQCGRLTFIIKRDDLD